MAGFFGLFDYTKPGPGVDKNAPKKKFFVQFWELFFRKFWDLILSNLLYILACLPVVVAASLGIRYFPELWVMLQTNPVYLLTGVLLICLLGAVVGLANVGLTYLTRNFSREKPVFLFADFWSAIRKNAKQAIGVGMINALFLVLIVFNANFFWTNYAETGQFFQLLLFALTGCIYILFTLLKYYLYMMLITFRFSLGQLYKNALLMVSAGLGKNVVISLILLVIYAVMIVPVILVDSLEFAFVFDSLLLLFLFPAFRSLLIQFYIFPVVRKYLIDPYYQKHPEEKEKARQILNISYDEENEKPAGEEAVFKDRGSMKPEGGSNAAPSQIPRQYSERELRGRGRERLQREDNEDDVI